MATLMWLSTSAAQGASFQALDIPIMHRHLIP